MEGGRFDTPERRAGLEARVNELTNAIGDETVRRYYRQDIWQRLRNLTAPRVPGSLCAGWLRAARFGPGRTPRILRRYTRSGGGPRAGGRAGRLATEPAASDEFDRPRFP